MTTNSLKITEVISQDTVALNPPALDGKVDLFNFITTLLFNAGKIESVEAFLEAVEYRETLGPTYMGNSIAIPHGKSPAVREPCVAFVRSQEGVYYESGYEKGMARLIFLLAIPEGMANEDYIRALSRLARLLIHEDFIDALYASQNYHDFFCAVEKAEATLE